MIVGDDVHFRRVYYWRGDAPQMRFRPEIADPPVGGWCHAFIIRGEKRSTIFCPYTLASYSVSNHCSEYMQSDEPKEWRRDAMVGVIAKNWEERCRLELPADLDTAALVLKRLGAEVPLVTRVRREDEDRTRGGKPVADKLLKPVKRKGKRGDFLAWFLEKPDETASIRECMAQFGISRSNALSYLFMLNKDHGIGYGLRNDAATVVLPDGVESPFEQ